MMEQDSSNVKKKELLVLLFAFIFFLWQTFSVPCWLSTSFFNFWGFSSFQKKKAMHTRSQ